MLTEFFAETDVSPELAAALMTLAPRNPFCTSSYAQAKRASGSQVWLFGTKQGGKLAAACYGFLSSGRLNRMLSISSLPDLPCQDVFWSGLLQFCYSWRITHLKLYSFASSVTRIPFLLDEVERYARCEYVLDLGSREWERRLARKHMQNIQKALQAGVTLRRSSHPDACWQHVRLMAASMERRRMRGESVPLHVEKELPWCILLTEKGAGQLFQAFAGRDVVSSAMIMRAAEGAYNESNGTSLEGMKCGANHFLMYAIAKQLGQESAREFNLGGSEFNPGLLLFKSRFGASPVYSESASFYLGGGLRRRVTVAARSLRDYGANTLRRIGARSRALIECQPPSPPAMANGLTAPIGGQPLRPPL
jgi:hypothetical protein